MDKENEYKCVENTVKVKSERIDLEAEYQEALPAYCDDIYRVLKCSARTFVSSVDISYNEIKVYGKTVISIAYYNEKSCLCYVDYEEEYLKTVPAENLSDAAFICAETVKKYTNFRVINQRRIDIHCASVIILDIYDKTKSPTVCHCDGAKLKIEKTHYCEPVSCVIDRISFDEEFNLPSDNQPVKRIIDYCLVPTLSEVKVIKDKALIKVSALAKIVYTADDSEETVVNAEYSFNVSKIVEAAGINDNDVPVIKLTTGSFFAKSKATGGEKINAVNLFGDIICNEVFVRKCETDIVTDGYNPGYVSNCEYSDLPLYTDNKCVNETNVINSVIKTNDVISKVEQLNVCIFGESFKNGVFTAVIYTDLIYRNNEGQLLSQSSDETAEINVQGYNGAIGAININSFDYNISSDKTVDVRINVKLDIYAYKCCNKKVLADIVNEEKKKRFNPLTVYFSKSGEKLWDIAKRLSSDEELIKRENGLNGDFTETDQVLIIPRG